MPTRATTMEAYEAYEVAERVMSVFSLIGSFIILTTFICWEEFRKPINRLIFFATFGNVAANIATLISTSALPSINSGTPKAFCTLQGVLIQWFMMADSFWIFCMANNVWLTFFRNHNGQQLRSLEKYYIAICYGIPFLPAFVYLMLDSIGHRGIYGEAVIWCWVSRKWDWMRIAFFYGPVWLVLTATSAIYIITGHNIFRQRNALRSFTRSPPSQVEVVHNPFTSENMANIERVTKIEVTTEKIEPDRTVLSDSGNDSRSSFSSTRNLSTEGQKYAGTNDADTRFVRVNWPYSARAPAQPTMSRTVAITGGNTDPVEDEETSIPYVMPPTPQTTSNRRRDAAKHANRAAWGYAKVAFLMFVALFIVWVPSTVNRVWALLRPDNPSFGLNLAAALVLPTQGFWNAMVYMATSRVQMRMAAKEIWCNMKDLRKNRTRPSSGTSRLSRFDLSARLQHRKDSARTLASDICMDEMAKPNLTTQKPAHQSAQSASSSPSMTSLPGRQT